MSESYEHSWAESYKIDHLHDLLKRVEPKLDHLTRKVSRMATDQATFDAALADFFLDLDAGLQAIADKLASLSVPVDLSTELAAVADAKTKFDAAVAADTA